MDSPDRRESGGTRKLIDPAFYLGYHNTAKTCERPVLQLGPSATLVQPTLSHAGCWRHDGKFPPTHSGESRTISHGESKCPTIP